MARRGLRRAAHEREVLVDDTGIHGVAQLRQATVEAVVQPHRVERLGLIQLRTRQDEVADRLAAEVRSLYRPGAADLAAHPAARGIERPRGQAAAARGQLHGFHADPRTNAWNAAVT